MAAEEISDLLGALKETDKHKGKLWKSIMDYWGYVNTDLVIHTDELPENLPEDHSFALILLGGQLNADGSMREELIGRLRVGLNCAKQYPNAYVVCTGGGGRPRRIRMLQKRDRWGPGCWRTVWKRTG